MKLELGLLFCVTIIATATFAQQTEREKTGSFEKSVSMGMTLTEGNSDTMQANAAFLFEGRKEDLGKLRTGLEANYGESTVDGENETTVEDARLFANVQKTLGDRSFASLNGDLLYDDIAEIDYRATLSPGWGYYLVKKDNIAFSTEAGPAYVWEKVAGEKEDYLALRFAERLDYDLSPTSKVWHSAEYLPKAEDFGDYLLNIEIGAQAAMNSRVNLRLVLQNQYDSTPGPGLEENDTALIAGLGVSW